MKRIRSLVAYDGTNYFGFQKQRPEHVTIQSTLEDVLHRITGNTVTVLGAGRTDRGVHASGQVIAFDVEWNHGVDDLERAMNAYLPADIAVRQMAEAEQGFHPRFDAKRRAYRYRIYNRPNRNPLERLYSWHVRKPLALQQMNRAASFLIGRSDLATFGQPPQGTNSEREIFACHWREEGVHLVMEIEANAFLYRMVRSIVGSLKLVGEGAWKVETLVQAWQSGDRSKAGQTAPPHGLSMISVTY